MRSLSSSALLVVLLASGCGAKHPSPAELPDLTPAADLTGEPADLGPVDLADAPDLLPPPDPPPPPPPPDMTMPGIVKLEAAPAVVAVGEPVELSWSLIKPVGPLLRCVLEFAESGVEDLAFDDCPVTHHVKHSYASAGARKPRLLLYAGGTKPVDTREVALDIKGPVTVALLTPLDGSAMRSWFDVRARVTSFESVKSVNAKLGPDSFPLTVTATPNEYAQNNVSPSTSGVQELIVTVETESGRRAEARARITYLRYDTIGLTVAQPLMDTVANPRLLVDAQCRSAAPGCTVRATTCGGRYLAEGTESLLAYVEPGDTGKTVDLCIEARDVAGNVLTATRRVHVENTPWYDTILAADEQILDYNDDAGAYVRTDRHWPTRYPEDPRVDESKPVTLVLVDRYGHPPKHITDDWTEGHPVYAASRSTVLLQQYVPARNHDGSYVWTEAAGLAPLDLNGISLRRRGDWGFFTDTLNVFTYRVSTGEKSAGEPGWNIDVAPDGKVARVSAGWDFSCQHPELGSQVFLDGTQLTHDADQTNESVSTDGKLAAYYKYKWDADCQHERVAMALHDGLHETLLTPYRDETPSPVGKQFLVRNGWVVYVDHRDEFDYVFYRRSPAGVTEKMTATTYEPNLEDVADDGSFVYTVRVWNERRHVDEAGHEMRVGSALGRAFAVRQFFLVSLGRSVFMIDWTANF